jgi:hypothetical protein
LWWYVAKSFAAAAWAIHLCLNDQDFALMVEMEQQEAFAPVGELAGTIMLMGLASAGFLLIEVMKLKPNYFAWKEVYLPLNPSTIVFVLEINVFWYVSSSLPESPNPSAKSSWSATFTFASWATVLKVSGGYVTNI